MLPNSGHLITPCSTKPNPKDGGKHGLSEKKSTYALAALVWPYLSVRS